LSRHRSRDAGVAAEQRFLAEGIDLRADVLEPSSPLLLHA